MYSLSNSIAIIVKGKTIITLILGKLPRYKTLLCIPEDISGIIMKAWKRTEE